MSQKMTGVIAGVVAGIVAAVVASRGVTNLMGGSEMKAKHGVASSIPSGWTKFHSADGGFTIATPKQFTQVDPKDSVIKEARNEVAGNNPELKVAMDNFANNPNVKFYAMDLGSAKTGFAINVNVTKNSLPSGVPKTDKALSEFRKGAESTIPPGSKIVKCEFVELPCGSAILTELDITIRDAVGSMPVRSVAYTIPDGKEMYSITMGVNLDAYTKTAPLFKSIADSFSVD